MVFGNLSRKEKNAHSSELFVATCAKFKPTHDPFEKMLNSKRFLKVGTDEIINVRNMIKKQIFLFNLSTDKIEIRPIIVVTKNG
jgi:hypothetical protein